MDADPTSVAEMRRLLESNACGLDLGARRRYAQPTPLRELLQAHDNLYIDLSFRDELRSYFAVSGAAGRTIGALLKSSRALPAGTITAAADGRQVPS
jgi:hypothetical protein